MCCLVKLYAIIFCLFAFIFCDNRVHRMDVSFNRNTPPSCDSYFDSENGHFRIHYGNCGSTYVDATTDYLISVAEAAEYSRNLLPNFH